MIPSATGERSKVEFSIGAVAEIVVGALATGTAGSLDALCEDAGRLHPELACHWTS